MECSGLQLTSIELARAWPSSAMDPWYSQHVSPVWTPDGHRVLENYIPFVERRNQTRRRRKGCTIQTHFNTVLLHPSLGPWVFVTGPTSGASFLAAVAGASGVAGEPEDLQKKSIDCCVVSFQCNSAVVVWSFASIRHREIIATGRIHTCRSDTFSSHLLSYVYATQLFVAAATIRRASVSSRRE